MPRSIPATLRRHPLSEAIARARRPLLAGSLMLCLAAPAFGAPVEIELSALGAGDGSQGFVLNGGAAEDAAGWSVSDAGDVNGDGTDDIIIGAHRADPGGRSEAGESYVVFGHSGAFPAALELSALQSANGGDGSQGFVLNGAIAGQYSGYSVGAAGDVNGDGIDDVIVGAPKLPPPGPMLPAAPGKSYVIFGHTSPSLPSWSSLPSCRPTAAAARRASCSTGPPRATLPASPSAPLAT